MAAAPRGPARPARPGRSGGQNPLLNPSQTLSGRSLDQAAQGIADAQTKGPIAELTRAIARQQHRGAGAQARTAGYFNQLGQFGQYALGAENQIAGDLNGQLQGIANDTQNRLQGLGQSQQASLAARVPGGEGGGLGTAGQGSLTGQLGQQQGFAAQNAGTFRSAGAVQGANYRGLAASNLGTYGLRGQERLGDIGRASQLAEAPLNDKIAGLQASRGALKATALGKLRSDERNFALAQAGLGIKQSSLAATIANDQARNALTQRGQNITLNGQQLAQMRSDRQYQLDQQKFGATTAKDNYLRAHGLGPYRPSRTGGSGGSPGGLSLAGQNGVYRQIDTLRALIRDGQQHHQTEAQIRQHLASGQNPSNKSYPASLIQAAYELQGWGFITHHTASQLYAMGLRGKGPYRISNPPAPTVGRSVSQGARGVGRGVGSVLGL